MVGKLLEPEIRGMIEARDFAALRAVFHEWAPADVAEVIVDLPEDEQVIIFRVLPHDLAADVFEGVIEGREIATPNARAAISRNGGSVNPANEHH